MSRGCAAVRGLPRQTRPPDRIRLQRHHRLARCHSPSGADHQGTVRELVDHATREIIEEIDFDAFGNILAVNDTPGADPTSRYAYTGREYDAETGLNYHRNRYLDLANGVWISEDPIGFAGGTSNLYVYVGSSPVNYVDPSGQIWHAVVGGAVGAAIGGGIAAWNGGSWVEITTGAAAGFAGGFVGVATGNWAAGQAAAVGAGALAGAMIGGAVAGGVESAVIQAVTTGEIDPQQVRRDAAIGAVTAGIGFAVAQFRKAIREAIRNRPPKATPTPEPSQTQPAASEPSTGAGQREPRSPSPTPSEPPASPKPPESPSPPPTPGIPSTINLNPTGLQHVLDRHFPGGTQSQGKSIFNPCENIFDLIKGAETIPAVRQPNGRFERVVNAGRPIGIDRVTGQPTSIYTVITNAAGELITAFPGVP